MPETRPYIVDLRPCDHWMLHTIDQDFNAMRALPVIHLQDELYLSWRALLAARGETMASRVRDHIQRDVSRLSISQHPVDSSVVDNSSDVDVVDVVEDSSIY